METLKFVGCTRREIADRLRAVIDPEVGVNIVDLGLIYDISTDGSTVVIELTMTTPACPLSSHITSRIEQEISLLPGVEVVETELVWDPRWSPEMMDAEVRDMLRG